MAKIEIRGVIVPADLDNSYWEEEITSGVIIPESRVRKMIAAASKNEPLELYVNSPGGSIVAGNEMVNSVVAWRNETKQPVNITVGALCASAASTFAALLGPVTCYENTEFMFHGAMGENWGGAQSMRDAAERIDRVNRKVISALITKYSMAPELVVEWFSEGRMGWLNAQQAMEIGLVKEIIPTNDALISFADIDLAQMQQRGLAIAAMLEPFEQREQTGDMKMEFLKKIAQMLGIEKDDVKPEEVEQAMDDKLKQADVAYEEGKEAGKVEAREEITAELKQQHEQALSDIQSKLDAALTEKADLQAAADKAAKDLEQAQQQIKSLTKGFRQQGGGDGDVSGAGYWDAVEAHVKDGMSKDAAMLRVQREQPELHQQMLEEAKKAKK